MSEFCDFAPNDPDCVPVEPDHHDDHHDDHEMHEEGGHGGFDPHDAPMLGQLMYLNVALFGAISGFLEMFVYHGEHGDAADVLPYPALLEGLEALHHYTHFGLMTVLTVTQILSMMGIAVEINIMAWMYAEIIEIFTQFIMKVGFMVVYYQAHEIHEDDSNSAADIASAEEVMTDVSSHTLTMAVEETSAHMVLIEQHENWMRAQLAMLPEEKRSKYEHGDHGGHGDEHEEEEHEEHERALLALVQRHSGYFII